MQDKEKQLYCLLHKEYGYYLAILDFLQQEQLKLKSLNEVALILKQKKIIMSCIAELEGDLKPLKEHWKSKTDYSDFASLCVNKELLALDTLLQQIMLLDSESQKHIKEYHAI